MGEKFIPQLLCFFVQLYPFSVLMQSVRGLLEIKMNNNKNITFVSLLT